METYDTFAQRLEYAALNSEVDESAVIQLCETAIEYRMGFVVVNPIWVPTAVWEVKGTALRVVATVAFPLGSNRTDIKAVEAVEAVEDGAHEIDMVANIGWLVSGRVEDAASEIRKVRRNLPESTPLKVIIETSKLTSSQIAEAVEAVIDGGAQFVKTGTGFFGGVTVQTIEAMKRVAGTRIPIKASGGIRTLEQCQQLIAAGATRLGSSSCPQILDEFRQTLPG